MNQVRVILHSTLNLSVALNRAKNVNENIYTRKGEEKKVDIKILLHD